MLGICAVQAEESGAVFDSWDEETKPVMFPILQASKKDVSKPGKLLVSVKEQVMSQLRYLLTTQHEYKTLVIDSITSFHRMLELEHEHEHELCVRDGVDNVAEACGGFHKGYLATADWHGEIMNALNILRNRGMTIIILAHAGVQRFKNRPDVDDYTVWSLEMNEKSTPVYTNYRR